MLRQILLVVALSTTAACAQDVDADVTSLESSLWTVGLANGNPPEWDSGVTTSLSAWQSVTCTQTYGANYLPTGLTGWPDKGSLDEYLARVEVTCTEYQNGVGGWFEPTGHERTALLASSSYDTPSAQEDIFNTWLLAYAVGVKLNLSPGGNYVRKMKLLYVRPTTGHYLADYGTPLETFPVPSLYFYESEEPEVICPDQTVMSGISVRTSTGSGKIRALRIYCRPLTYSGG